MGVVFCPSFHALRTTERATRRRRLTPILSYDKALASQKNKHINGRQCYLYQCEGQGDFYKSGKRELQLVLVNDGDRY
jgi:hypothetical protein